MASSTPVSARATRCSRGNATERPRRAALFPVRRPEMKATFRFVHRDPDRWTVMPRNLETEPEERRPKG